MFNFIKDNIMCEAVLSERLRTIFLLSKHLRKPISVLLQKPNQYIDQAIVHYGIINSVFHGTSANKAEHHKYIGGTISFGDKEFKGDEIRLDFSEVQAISIGFEDNPVEMLKRKDSVNVIQHLRPFTGFGADTGTNESHYYHFLTLLMRKTGDCGVIENVQL